MNKLICEIAPGKECIMPRRRRRAERLCDNGLGADYCPALQAYIQQHELTLTYVTHIAAGMENAKGEEGLLKNGEWQGDPLPRPKKEEVKPAVVYPGYHLPQQPKPPAPEEKKGPAFLSEDWFQKVQDNLAAAILDLLGRTEKEEKKPDHPTSTLAPAHPVAHPMLVAPRQVSHTQSHESPHKVKEEDPYAINLSDSSILIWSEGPAASELFVEKMHKLSKLNPGKYQGIALVTDQEKFSGLAQSPVFSGHIFSYSEIMEYVYAKEQNPLLTFEPNAPEFDEPKEIIMIESIEHLFDPDFGSTTRTFILKLLHDQKEGKHPKLLVVCSVDWSSPNLSDEAANTILTLFSEDKMIHVAK